MESWFNEKIKKHWNNLNLDISLKDYGESENHGSETLGYIVKASLGSKTQKPYKMSKFQSHYRK